MKSFIKSFVMNFLPSQGITIIRDVRNIGFMLLSPFERLIGVSNPNNPPIYLKRYIGSPKDFVNSGVEFAEYLKKIAVLKQYEAILDIGCGPGSTALPLTGYMDKNGKYVGIDIYNRIINWCLKNITPRFPNFEFYYANVYNPIYNKKGVSAKLYQLPFANDAFDVVLLKSVFTHMRPEDVKNYLSEIFRVLKKEGRCLATFFILNDEQKKLKEAGANTLEFSFGNDDWRYLYEKSPETGIAYRENFITHMIKKSKLHISKIYYGSWSGRDNGVCFQDMILFEKMK